MSSYASANLGPKFISATGGAEALSVALIGPDGERRNAMLSALGDDGRSSVSEFESYPSRPEEYRWLREQRFDVILIDLDSDADVALALVQRIKATESVKVMVYSNRSDTKLAVRFMRAGAREYLLLPLEPGILREALDRAEAAIREEARPARKTAGNLFVCLCAKGGSGVTTVACNLAVALAREPAQKTLLIDLALPIGDAALALGITSRYSTEDALRNIERLDARLLEELLVKHKSGAYVLAAPSHVLALDGCGEAIDKLIALARKQFDHVIVDLGSRMDLARTDLFKKASTIYLVTLTGVSELRNSKYLISQFFPAGGPKLEVVVNRFESRLLGGVNEDVVNKALGRPVRWKIPDDREAAREMQFGEIGAGETRIAQAGFEMASAITGQPVPQEKKKSFSLRNIGKTIAEEVAPADDAPIIKIVPPPVVRETPEIAWSAPEPIQYGEALSAAQLNASSPVAGTFEYSPASGAVLPAGEHTLAATFTSADRETYTQARASVSISVSRATPEIAWPGCEPISYGAALGSDQLCATASVPGTFAYTPGAGTTVAVGVHALSAEFTPSDAANYSSVRASASIKVTKAMPAFEWPVPRPIRFGTQLSAKQLCATASVPGSFEYAPAAGAMLPVGTHTLSVTFSPADSANYSAAQATLSLHVERATPMIEWPTPAAVIFGTPLSSAQLCATASVAGRFDYSPAPGAVLAAGFHRLSVTFTPDDRANYATARAAISLDVAKATPGIYWPAPEAIKFGAQLSQLQFCASASVAGTFAYSPGPGVALTAGVHTLSAIFTPADAANYATVQATVPITVEPKATPVIAWPAPRPLTYGTPLGGQQLCAAASVPGTFAYSVEPGTKLGAGKHDLSVTFTPFDTENYAAAHATISLEVVKATPTIDWDAPKPMMEGTPLSAAQLCAAASLPGTFDYSPAPGTQLPAGTHTLTATFTPADSNNCSTAHATVPLYVLAREMPAIQWPAIYPISYGTPLSKTQLCATASVAGTFDYSPANGETLPAGTHRLSVRFTPADTVNYATAEATATLIVEREPAVVAWLIPDPITYDTRLSDRQLCATASVPGKFDYSPALGALLPAGTHTLAVTFTPTDSDNYAAAQATVQLEIAKATPAIEWTAPKPIQSETGLSATQLCAKTSIPGSMDYSPEPGTVLPVGVHTLSVLFTPSDSANYVTAQASVSLTVIVKPSPVIAWRSPDPISYGTPLGSNQLCATASVPGKFHYSPGAGATLDAGVHTLSVTFTPTDAANYATARATISLTVEKAAPTIDWPPPKSIKPGTPLSDAQLDALAWIPGTFDYSPAAGEVLPPGTHTLSVTFTPESSANYMAAHASVTLKVVAKALPVITWANPDPIASGTRLSSTQLCATASVPGIFDYSPELGELLPVGRHTLSVSFIPTDTEEYRAAQATVVLQVQALPAAVPSPAAPASIERPKPVVKPLMPETSDAVSEPVEPTNWPYTVHAARPQLVEPEIEEIEGDEIEEEEKKPGVMWLIAAAAGFFSILLFLLLVIPSFHRAPAFTPRPSTQPEPAESDLPLQSSGEPGSASPLRSVHATPAQASASPTVAKPNSAQAEMMNAQLHAPARIPQAAQKPVQANAAPPGNIATAGLGGNGTMGPVFNGQAPRIVMALPPGRIVVASSVAMGLLIHKTLPDYPAIAKQARVAGVVVIQANISKEGTIEILHAVSGPMMLREAALDAVRTWRYKPYTLNNQPIEIETTISVNFALGN